MSNLVQNIFGGSPTSKLFLIAGPCAVESLDTCMEVAERVKDITQKLDIDYIFKASYRKANRSSINSFSGIGDEKALDIIQTVSQKLNLPSTTDIHSDEEAAMAAEVVDVLQIPAFLCRQTSLLVAAAETGKAVNIKKGQFLNADAMKHAINKVKESGNDMVGVIERGTTFGYQDLVVDMRSFPIMSSFKVPVIMDCTHSLQQPNQSKGVTGGQPQFISTIANSSIAAGANGLFIETHPDPSKALSDGANMLHLDDLESVLTKAKSIFDTVQCF